MQPGFQHGTLALCAQLLLCGTVLVCVPSLTSDQIREAVISKSPSNLGQHRSLTGEQELSDDQRSLSEALLSLRPPATSWDQGAVELRLCSHQQWLLQVVCFVFVLSHTLHTLLTLEFWMWPTLTLLPSPPPCLGHLQKVIV